MRQRMLRARRRKRRAASEIACDRESDLQLEVTDSRLTHQMWHVKTDRNPEEPVVRRIICTLLLKDEAP